MKIGISTSNLYPINTEDSLEQLLKLGFKTFEIFLNTESEIRPPFVQELKKRADAYGAQIVSIHPYTSCVEPYLLFSQYKRRFWDGLTHYQQLFEAAAGMGASYVILHGDKMNGVLNEEEVFSRYEKLFDLGQSYGITLLQENVVNHRSSEISFINHMRNHLKNKACFTLDIKQCRRRGIEPTEYIHAMGDGLKHVHISDQSEKQDCMLPGKGNNDFAGLKKAMLLNGFHGVWILELYHSNFNLLGELFESCKYLEIITKS